MWDFVQSNILLRVAPWADIPDIRSKLIERCRSFCHSDELHKSIDEYENGEVPTLPDTWEFRDQLYPILEQQYSDFRDDLHWYEGHDYLKFYFFRDDLWIKK